MFIDIAKIELISGDGGAGWSSFRREKFVPNGGPDGGDGGKGADVIFISDHNLKSLMDFTYKRKYQAQNGLPGEQRNKHGKNAEDLIIHVPVGTIIKTSNNEEVLIDFTEDGQTYCAAAGGIGGKGNSNFATSVNQVPYYSQKGLPGEKVEVMLELKLIADVGIIGFPNVGKSTLISVLTKSKPKIADYPFTTLVPNLGVMKFGDDKHIVIADLPGIIEGAHTGHGLGHQFLRHAERTKLLIHVLDVSDFYQRDVFSDFNLINKEMELFNPEILKKRQIIVFNKMDAIQDEDRLFEMRSHFKDMSVIEVSAITGDGLAKLSESIAQEIL